MPETASVAALGKRQPHECPCAFIGSRRAALMLFVFAVGVLGCRGSRDVVAIAEGQTTARPSNVAPAAPENASPQAVGTFVGPVRDLVSSGKDGLWYVVTDSEVAAIRLGAKPEVLWRVRIGAQQQRGLRRAVGFATPDGGVLAVLKEIPVIEARPDKVTLLSFDSAGTKRWELRRKFGWHGWEWERAAPWPPVLGGVTILDGDDVVAVDMQTGSTKWERAEPMSALLESEGVLVARPKESGTYPQGTILGLDVDAGRTLWTARLPKESSYRVVPSFGAAASRFWLRVHPRVIGLDVRTGSTAGCFERPANGSVLLVDEVEGGPLFVVRTYEREPAVEGWDLRGRRMWRQPLQRSQRVCISDHESWQVRGDRLYLHDAIRAEAVQIVGLPDGRDLGILRVRPGGWTTPLIAERGRLVAATAGRGVYLFSLPSYQPVLTIPVAEADQDAGVAALKWVSDQTLLAGTSAGEVVLVRVGPPSTPEPR